MALITYSDYPSKGGSFTVTLNKSELMAIPEIAADTYWSVATNIKTALLYFKTPVGGQSKAFTFEMSATTPTTAAEVSFSARDLFQLEKIILNDFDGGSFVVHRATFLASVPSLADLDITVGPPQPAPPVSAKIRVYNSSASAYQDVGPLNAAPIASKASDASGTGLIYATYQNGFLVVAVGAIDSRLNSVNPAEVPFGSTPYVSFSSISGTLTNTATSEVINPNNAFADFQVQNLGRYLVFPVPNSVGTYTLDVSATYSYPDENGVSQPYTDTLQETITTVPYRQALASDVVFKVNQMPYDGSLKYLTNSADLDGAALLNASFDLNTSQSDYPNALHVSTLSAPLNSGTTLSGTDGFEFYQSSGSGYGRGGLLKLGLHGVSLSDPTATLLTDALLTLNQTTVTLTITNLRTEHGGVIPSVTKTLLVQRTAIPDIKVPLYEISPTANGNTMVGYLLENQLAMSATDPLDAYTGSYSSVFYIKNVLGTLTAEVVLRNTTAISGNSYSWPGGHSPSTSKNPTLRALAHGDSVPGLSVTVEATHVPYLKKVTCTQATPQAGDFMVTVTDSGRSGPSSQLQVPVSHHAYGLTAVAKYVSPSATGDEKQSISVDSMYDLNVSGTDYKAVDVYIAFHGRGNQYQTWLSPANPLSWDTAVSNPHDSAALANSTANNPARWSLMKGGTSSAPPVDYIPNPRVFTDYDDSPSTLGTSHSDQIYANGLEENSFRQVYRYASGGSLLLSRRHKSGTPESNNPQILSSGWELTGTNAGNYKITIGIPSSDVYTYRPRRIAVVLNRPLSYNNTEIVREISYPTENYDLADVIWSGTFYNDANFAGGTGEYASQLVLSEVGSLEGIQVGTTSLVYRMSRSVVAEHAPAFDPVNSQNFRMGSTFVISNPRLKTGFYMGSVEPAGASGFIGMRTTGTVGALIVARDLLQQSRVDASDILRYVSTRSFSVPDNTYISAYNGVPGYLSTSGVLGVGLSLSFEFGDPYSSSVYSAFRQTIAEKTYTDQAIIDAITYSSNPNHAQYRDIPLKTMVRVYQTDINHATDTQAQITSKLAAFNFTLLAEKEVEFTSLYLGTSSPSFGSFGAARTYDRRLVRFDYTAPAQPIPAGTMFFVTVTGLKYLLGEDVPADIVFTQPGYATQSVGNFGLKLGVNRHVASDQYLSGVQPTRIKQGGNLFDYYTAYKYPSDTNWTVSLLSYDTILHHASFVVP